MNPWVRSVVRCSIQTGTSLFPPRSGLAGARATRPNWITSDQEGHFLFTGVPAGPFQVTITAEGFGIRQEVGVLHAGEALEMPRLSLAVAGEPPRCR